jgi:penicillin-insensitive murein endopeptidase
MKKNLGFLNTFVLLMLLTLAACGRMSAEVTKLDDPSAVPSNSTTKSDSQPSPPVKDDLLNSDNEEPSDSYDSPFNDINNQFDASSPEVRQDLTPQGEIKDQAVGTFQKGYLQNASNLFVKQLSYGEKSPFQIIYPGRRTFFGTADIVSMIDYLAQCLQSLVSGLKLLIGDISTEHGKQLGSHKSHQIGMDADIGYIQNPELKVASFTNVTKDISRTLMLKEQLYLFQFAVMTHNVDRIFVHPTIKAAICKTALDLKLLESGHEIPAIQETLRRLIPDKDHGTHFHIRIKCSKAQPHCVPMSEPKPGTGC